ncbi:hypothetical protein [Aliagarivorans marinus]|uniref:hypothetical protein n=1 Tax=Aliagarivorans marinus TaxID=561965 RepID=UPI0012FAF9BA|nr:hypothetical protein [Aliagarivorans marinus]
MQIRAYFLTLLMLLSVLPSHSVMALGHAAANAASSASLSELEPHNAHSVHSGHAHHSAASQQMTTSDVADCESPKHPCHSALERHDEAAEQCQQICQIMACQMSFLDSGSALVRNLSLPDIHSEPSLSFIPSVSPDPLYKPPLLLA